MRQESSWREGGEGRQRGRESDESNKAFNNNNNRRKILFHDMLWCAPVVDTQPFSLLCFLRHR